MAYCINTVHEVHREYLRIQMPKDFQPQIFKVNHKFLTFYETGEIFLARNDQGYFELRRV